MKRCLIVLVLIVALGVFPAQAQEGASNSVQFNGLGFSFDSALATNVSITQYPGDPTDVQQPGGPEARHTQFNLFSQPPAPESFFDAPVSVRIYRLADLSAYEGSAAQVAALQGLLANRPDLASYTVVSEATPSLPYLPLVAASQVVRARVGYVDTPTLSGIRYITVYRQDVSPFVNNEFQYTIQGISSDGQYYVSAVMRITAPEFPAEIPADFNYETFSANFNDYLTESVATLNAPAPEGFAPSLAALDALAQTITLAPADGGTPVVEPTAGDPTLGGLAGVQWTLVSYGPADAPIPALEVVPVTATFSEQGIGGSAGCNTYGGPFLYDAGTISSGPLISTLIACEPLEVTTQEAAYLAALGSATSYTVGNGQLQIFYDGGVLTFTAPVTA